MGASVGRKEEERRGGGEERRGLGRREEGAQVGRGRRGKSVGCGLISRKPDSTGHISQGNQSALQGPKLGADGEGWLNSLLGQHSQSTAGTPAESSSPSPPSPGAGWNWSLGGGLGVWFPPALCLSRCGLPLAKDRL